MEAKIDGGKLPAAVTDALTPHINALYATLGKRVVVVAELVAAERTEVAEDETGKPTVKLRLGSMEVASDAHADQIRKVQRALYLHRTAYGKITEDMDVELASSWLADAAGDLNAREAGRVRAGVREWLHRAYRVQQLEDATATELRHEIDTLVAGLRAILDGSAYPDIEP